MKYTYTLSSIVFAILLLLAIICGLIFSGAISVEGGFESSVESGGGGGGSGGGSGGSGLGGGGGSGEGGEGGEGGGSSGLDTSGSLSGGENGESNDGEPSIVARLYSDQSGTVYLKVLSFGSFALASDPDSECAWTPATPYSELLHGEYSADYLIGLSLSEMGFLAHELKIEPLSKDYMLPYYLTPMGGEYRVQTSDVHFQGDVDAIYTVPYYTYAYIGSSSLQPQLPAALTEAEQRYRSFVYEQYLDVPASTLAFLQEIIREQGFDASDADIIMNVAHYIQGAATYNKNYNPEMNKETDVVTAFLSEYKEGVCRHYASAATLLYRALGIPARYTGGYKATVTQGEWVDLDADQTAHAWVEVYLDGCGWVQVEVTGGMTDGGNDSEENEQEKLGKITVMPEPLYMQYNGTSALRPDANTKLISAQLLNMKGYTYTAVLSGERLEVGYGKSVIEEFHLFDASGAEVTDQYEIEYKEGILQVYEAEITVVSGSREQAYNTEVLLPDPNDYSVVGSLLSPTHRLEIVMTASIVNAGSVVNRFTATVFDEQGNDISHTYKINKEYGSLTVTRRTLTITAGSAKKSFDGEALTCDEYEITAGELCADQQVTVQIEGSQTDIGRSSNKIRSVKIYDLTLTDVTNNYQIKLVSGTLTVRISS